MIWQMRQKNKIERRAGVYTDKLGRPDVQQQYDEKYNEYYKEILRGVDTYWLENLCEWCGTQTFVEF
ncbi:MAG: hypothetical protein ACLTZT_07575 [Butyricimonas faecalis]